MPCQGCSQEASAEARKATTIAPRAELETQGAGDIAPELGRDKEFVAEQVEREAQWSAAELGPAVEGSQRGAQEQGQGDGGHTGGPLLLEQAARPGDGGEKDGQRGHGL